MEESEKRKERLRAMRMEAARAGSSDSPEASAEAGCLANPLIETQTPQSQHGQSRASPRFDYYTDPMSAFSGDRARGNAGFQSAQVNFTPPPPRLSGPRNLVTSPSPAYQWRPIYPPNSGIYRTESPRPRCPPHQSPSGYIHPFPMQDGASPQAWNRSSSTASYFSPSSTPGSGTHSFNQTQDHSHWHGNSPGPGLGRGVNYAASPGRGRGQWFGGSPRSGRSGGRGPGHRGHGSTPARPLGPERFFHESMLDDPWKDLKPVLWRGVDSPFISSSSLGSSSSWMPESIRPKKLRVAESPNKFGSGLNLAEFLAASFNETVKETPSP
ncbi:protein SICKLE [Rhodamnia argentea]|uniref:Protein SICKLE n=1 Tax=Rhodamnia argentea TaxID=178133 RepID=A0A8B8PGN8_9MYRT|nr:protein SICKLE [Rhodamnia argentea]XP_030533858.1 protein SICKLE [Rhodamnia argentea]XP_048130487.1 protein SICKLE [Rhodamnia argentea]